MSVKWSLALKHQGQPGSAIQVYRLRPFLPISASTAAGCSVCRLKTEIKGRYGTVSERVTRRTCRVRCHDISHSSRRCYHHWIQWKQSGHRINSAASLPFVLRLSTQHPHIPAQLLSPLFMPPPQLGGAGDIMFYVFRPSVCACINASVRDTVSAISIACIDGFYQTSVSSAPWNKCEVIVFWGQKS